MLGDWILKITYKELRKKLRVICKEYKYFNKSRIAKYHSNIPRSN